MVQNKSLLSLVVGKSFFNLSFTLFFITQVATADSGALTGYHYSMTTPTTVDTADTSSSYLPSTAPNSATPEPMSDETTSYTKPGTTSGDSSTFDSEYLFCNYVSRYDIGWHAMNKYDQCTA